MTDETQDIVSPPPIDFSVPRALVVVEGTHYTGFSRDEMAAAGIAPDLIAAAFIDVDYPPVTDMQMRAALNAAGTREAFENYVAAANWSVKDWWQRTTIFKRSDPTGVAAFKAFGMNDAQINALFTQAAAS